MITIDRMILHILDPSQNVLVCGDSCIQPQEEWMGKLESKITKAFTSTQKKTGIFQANSYVKELVDSYRNHHEDFTAMSKQLATYLFETKRKYAQYEPSTFLMVGVTYDEERYLVGLDNAHQEAWTHKITQEEEKLITEFAICPAIIAPSLIKRDCVFMMNLKDDSVSSVESKVEIEGNKCYFYHDKLLSCTSATSYRDALKTMNQACAEVIKGYDLDAVKVLPKMKQAIKDSVEAKEDIRLPEIAQEVFHDQPLAKQRFIEQIKEQGIKEKIKVEHHKPSKAERVQKIQTDKGIELIIPVDYMNTTEYVEFHTEEDGRISIELKNINRIISK